MAEHMKIQELHEYTGYAVSTLRSMTSSKEKMEFQPGVHYIKPSHKNIIYIKSAIDEWLQQKHEQTIQKYANRAEIVRQKKQRTAKKLAEKKAVQQSTPIRKPVVRQSTGSGFNI
ncbi:hypothetical protein K8I31_10210 [bacterium]|nr:hypothetical protein [bacterium]